MNEAYLLEDYSEEDGIAYDYCYAIVFAENSEAAKQQANIVSYCSDAEYIHCHRIPFYDQYSSLGYVPSKVLYDNDFTLVCANCNADISTSVDYEECDEDDTDCEPYDPQFVNEVAYCCPFCKESHTEELLVKEKGFKLFNSLFQNVQVNYSYFTGDRSLGVDFNFPGGSYKVTWFSNNPKVVNVSTDDVETWNRYRDQ